MFDRRHADDPRLGTAAALPPGPEQWAAVRALDAVSLSHHDRLVAIELVERCKAALDADEQPLYAALAHHDAGHDDCPKRVREELALATGYSATTCGSRLTVGRALVERFPETLALMAGGEVTYWYGRALVDETACLTPEKAALVEKRVLDAAPLRRLGEYRQAVRRAVVAVDPEGAAERTAAAQRQRNVWVSGVADATVSLGASRVPVADAVAAYEHIDRLARATAGDGRTLEQRRADTFLALLRGEPIDPDRSVATTVDVLVSAEILHGGDAPGELDAAVRGTVRARRAPPVPHAWRSP